MNDQQRSPMVAETPLEGNGTELTALLARPFKPNSAQTALAMEEAVTAFAKLALADSDLVSPDARERIEVGIAQLDRLLGQQVNEILHHPELQQLEGSWRGLHHFVNNSKTGDMLKIQVLSVTKDELGKTLRKFRGAARTQSPVYKKLYTQAYDTLGGEPYACIVCDYEFDHGPQDTELLGELGKLAADAHAPVITAPSPRLLGMQSWQELGNPRDLTKVFSLPEYAGWHSLRKAEESRCIALAMPRFLSRLPYGARTHPVEGFNFEESTGSGDHHCYTWSNACYAMAANINRSFDLFGWGTNIRGVESGGIVEGLPTHTFATGDGDLDMKCPTEISIDDEREGELARSGLMPLLHRKNSDAAAFIGAQSLHKPEEFHDPDATANANLSARLPYLFACARFAHHLKCIVRDKCGSNLERGGIEKFLNNWIMNYVDGDPANSSPEVKAQKPLAGAEVVVEDVPGDPGKYTAKFFLRPHYQLEGLTVGLRLVSRLPSQRAA